MFPTLMELKPIKLNLVLFRAILTWIIAYIVKVVYAGF